MKITLLLLVVFVSTTLASPYFRRGKEPGRPQPPPPPPRGDGEKACERAMIRCDGETGTDISDRQMTQTDAQEDADTCGEWLDEQFDEITGGMKRNADDEELKEVRDSKEKCKEKIEKCFLPEQRAIKLLRQLVRSEGDAKEDECDNFLDRVDEINMDGSGDKQEGDQKSESTESSGPNGGKERELRNLLRKLYGWK